MTMDLTDLRMDKEAIFRFFEMMRKREMLRLAKESGAPWPWTDDPILRDYKFTNVKRTDDRTTRELVAEFYAPFRAGTVQAKEVALLNCAIARYFGTVEFMRAVGWQYDFQPAYLKAVARKRLDRGERVYTGAYMISPCNRTGPKEAVVVDVFLADLWRRRADVIGAIYTSRWEIVHEAMSRVEGFGGTGFMAKETILDTRLVTGLWKKAPTDRMTWTPLGPGSRRGAGRILGDESGRAVNPRTALQICRHLFALARRYLPDALVDRLELHDIQFQLCEYSKYEKVRLGQGRPRSVYRKPE